MENHKPRLAVVFNSQVLVLQLVQAAAGAWHPMWLVDRETLVDQRSLRLLSRLGTVIDLTGLDPAGRADCVAEYHPDGVIAFADSDLVQAAQIGTPLGLPVNSADTAIRLTNKLAQRVALENAGLPVPRFWPAPMGMGDEARRELVRDVSQPSIVKPQHGAGSRHTYRAVSVDALERILRENRSTDLIVEELLPDGWERMERPYADFVSVESVLACGRLHHLGITGRATLAEPFLDTGVFVPAFLPPGLDLELMDIAGQAIAALGARVGCFHTEIKLTPKGPCVIEVNGRVGGSLPELFQLAGMPSMLDIVCRAALGESLRLDGPPRPRRVAYDLVLSPPVWASRLSRLDHVEMVGQIPGVVSIDVNRTPGDEVDWREGYDGRIYTVFGSADDHAAMWTARQRVLDTLAVEFT